jgi:hypothetical protein
VPKGIGGIGTLSPERPEKSGKLIASAYEEDRGYESKVYTKGIHGA